jgi:3-oxoacyl-[acyl-carrier protein] reductase
VARIVLTGGASGLGAAIAEKLAADPAHSLSITYCHSLDSANALCERFPNVQAHHVDFTDIATVEAFAETFDIWQPDVLINNATGGLVRKQAHKFERDAWLGGFSTNVLPVIELTNRVLRGFRTRRSGRVITILTDALVGAPPLGMAEYVAGKAYLESLSRSWAVENAGHGITSNCVLPSMMFTGPTTELDERVLAQYVESLPTKRLLDLKEAAEVVAFLVTCTPYVNGVRWVVNGARQLL